MTPQEHELLTGLFDRLATLENQARDPDAERAIIEGLRRAPNATYALVQTTLVQDEALKRANARIQELEAQLDSAPPARPGGFLDNMRDALLGPRASAHGSVPSVRPGSREEPQDQGIASSGPAPLAPGAPAPVAPPATAWRQGPAPALGGGSFLGTAAAAAAGTVGASLLLDSIRSMGHGGSAFGVADPALGGVRDSGSPWDRVSGGDTSGGDTSGGDLGRSAGVDDIGHDQHQGGDSGSDSGSFDNVGSDDLADAQADQDPGAFDDSSSDFGGGDDFGSTDV